jgi:hypothetical protein
MGIKTSEYIQMMKYMTRPASPKQLDTSVKKLEKALPTATIVEEPNNYEYPMPTFEGLEDPKLRQVELATGGIADLSASPVVKPATKMQEQIAQKVYGKSFAELDPDKRSKIRIGRITMNSGGVNLMGFEERIAYTKKRMQDFVANFEKERGRLPSRQEVRKIGKFEFGTIKKYVDEGIVEVGERGATMGLNNPKVIELKNDLRLLDNNTYIQDSFRKGQVPNLNEVAKILGVKDKSIAAYRVGQLAATYTGDRKVEGIKPKFKKGAEFIFENADAEYTPAFRRVRELQIGKSVDERSIATTKNAIKRFSEGAYPEGASYAIDEPAGISSSVRRGTTPYGVFGQIIDSEINSALKYEFDRKKSINERALQEAMEGGSDADIKAAVKKFNNTVSEYEKKLNEGVKPGQKRIKLFKVSLNNPEKTIANFSDLSESYQNAFRKNYNTRGYSFKVPSDIKPLSQIADELKIEKNKAKLSSAAAKGAPRVYAETIPFSRATGEYIQGIADNVAAKQFGKASLKLLGGAGVAYGIYDTGVGYMEGKSGPELAARFVGLDPVYQTAKEFYRMSPEGQELQKKKNALMSFEASQYDAMDEGLVGLRTPQPMTDEETKKLEVEKAIAKENIANEESQVAAERKASVSGLVNFFRDRVEAASGQPYELAFAGGGRVQLADGGKPSNIGRRKFVKGILTLAAAVPFLGPKIFKPVSKAAPEVIEAVTRSADSIPTYLGDLIGKVKMMGTSKIIGKVDNPDGFINYRLGDYEVVEGVSSTRIKKIRDKGDYGYEEFEMQLEKDPETGAFIYDEVTARPDMDGKLKDIDFGIDDEVHQEMKKFAYDK